ncbi:MAG: lysis system i-spanin subunit Rz [Pseudoalteromonas distincta]
MIDYIRLGIAAGALAVAAAGGAAAAWAWQDNAWTAKLASAQAVHESTLGEIARAGQRQLQEQQEKLMAERERLQALDIEHYGELEDARKENSRLQGMYADADSERRSLRIKVRVVENDLRVLETTAGSSLGNVAALELSPEAGSVVWDIRAGMIEDRAKLLYFQQLERERQASDGQ